MMLPAHSLGEAYLYLMLQTCSNCHRGPVKSGTATRLTSGKDSTGVEIRVECPACAVTKDWRFSLPPGQLLEPAATGAVINPTGECSRILDVGQWLTLFRIITEAAARETNKVQARHLGLEAAQCLEEALRFYEPSNDLPPPAAFFTDASRDRCRNHPQQFSKQRLLELRGKLPSLDAMREVLAKSRRRR